MHFDWSSLSYGDNDQQSAIFFTLSSLPETWSPRLPEHLMILEFVWDITQSTFWGTRAGAQGVKACEIYSGLTITNQFY